jgi:hypothetical protein
MSAISRIVASYAPSQYVVGRAIQTVEQEIDKVGSAVIGTIESGVVLAVGAVAETAKVGVSALGSVLDVWA